MDSWLPVGFNLPDGAIARIVLFEGTGWQILETQGGGRALVVYEELAKRWRDAGLIDKSTFREFNFGSRKFLAVTCGPSQLLCPVGEAKSPDSKAEALAFALALRATRKIDAFSALQDALYVEKITRLLPTYSISSRTEDDVLLGYWLTGGAKISATSFRRLHQSMGWLGANHLMSVVEAAGFEITELLPSEGKLAAPVGLVEPAIKSEKNAVQVDSARIKSRVFELAGRPDLAAFFDEHVVDIIQNQGRYKALGINFPSAIILHGPPGTGKTFAVERLIDFLGWPSYQIDASSVASPYIHETSKKVAQVFEQAIENSPSVLVIDEMEAFLADRDMGSGHHRIEEVAEFLRRIPEAVKNEVLVLAMTNRIEMIDSAVQRRGRFDHVIKVGFATEPEVRSLLDKLLSSLPIESNVDTEPLAKMLAGRPLSDVSFVVREGARLAAKSGKDRLDKGSLMAALNATPTRGERGGESKRRVGFV